MKAGDLAEVTVPIPTLFDNLGVEDSRVIMQGDLVMLLKYEPNRWYKPSWIVLHAGVVGAIRARWLRHYVECQEVVDERWESQTG